MQIKANLKLRKMQIKANLPSLKIKIKANLDLIENSTNLNKMKNEKKSTQFARCYSRRSDSAASSESVIVNPIKCVITIVTYLFKFAGEKKEILRNV